MRRHIPAADNHAGCRAECVHGRPIVQWQLHEGDRMSGTHCMTEASVGGAEMARVGHPRTRSRSSAVSTAGNRSARDSTAKSRPKIRVAYRGASRSTVRQ